MKKIGAFEIVSLVIIAPLVIAVIYQLSTTGKLAGISNKPSTPILTRCQKLQRSYENNLRDRTKAIMNGYHNKTPRAYDYPVALSADNLSKSPECIDKTADKGKIEMWANQYGQFALENMMK